MTNTLQQTMQNLSKRNISYDYAKGLGILLMVIGHCYSFENPILVLIYAFHMPLFFIVAGLQHAEHDHKHIRINWKKKCFRLIVPYLVFDGAFAVFVTILGRPDNFVQSIISNLTPVVTLVGKTVTWFLPSMLLCELLLWAFNKLFKGSKWVILLNSLLAIAAILIPPRINY